MNFSEFRKFGEIFDEEGGEQFRYELLGVSFLAGESRNDNIWALELELVLKLSLFELWVVKSCVHL